MFRKISKYLSQWKDSEYRKPLILQGARQVGKTYSLLEFGREQFQNVVYLNFETNPLFSRVFDESLDPGYLIPMLSRVSHQAITAGKTLIIFDEVQLCERALTSLKYFCENAPQYHVVAAGSLLGVAVNRTEFSFPVGKVDIKTMYPMDMEEFMLAFGQDDLVDEIKRCFDEDTPMPPVLHEDALSLYREYLVVGGIHECVDKYHESHDLTLIRHTQDVILTSYLNDMSKYNSQSDIRKTRMVYDNITVQLSKKNTRFQYKLIKTGARASEFENAIEWLALSGTIIRVYCVEQPTKPLDDHRDIDAFKTYVSDVGLLCAKKDVVPEDILLPLAELDDFKGALVENYAASQLVANEHTCYYWTSHRMAEVDFVIQRLGKVIPIEVKSSTNTKAKSLSVYMDRYDPEYAIKLSTKNFGYDGGVKSVPLYAAFCI